MWEEDEKQVTKTIHPKNLGHMRPQKLVQKVASVGMARV